MMYGAVGLPVLCMQNGGSWIFGGGLDRTSQMLRCLRMARITDGSLMLLVQEISAQNLRDAEDKMTVGDLFEDIHAQPFSELHHALLMTGWAEMTPLAGEGQEIS